MSNITDLLSQALPSTWEPNNQNELVSFLGSESGGKFVSHLKSVFQGLLEESMNESEPQSAVHKLAIAKGYSLAITALISNIPHYYTSTEERESKDDEQKVSEAKHFAKIISRPPVFK